MTIQEMADKILEVIQGCGSGASFVDIENACGDEAQGNLLVTVPTRDNTIVWGGVSKKFIHAFNIAKPKIYLQPSSFIIYAMDGKVLTYPLALRPRKKDYKKPHWYPVTFRMKSLSEMAGVA